MSTPDRDDIKRLVREQLTASLPAPPPATDASAPRARMINIAPAPMAEATTAAPKTVDETVKSVITEDDLRRIAEGTQIQIAPQAIITPLARDLAAQRGITFARGKRQRPQSQRPIALGADHGGFALKEQLKQYLDELGYAYNDFGTYSTNAVDYPDIAHTVASAVAGGQYWRGIIVDGAGIGSCMTANKVPGVRAALCYDQASAHNSRSHNDANVLTLGGRMGTEAQVRDIVRTFLETDCTEERHKARVAKIDLIERQYLR